MKKLKKILIIVLILFTTFTLSACQKEDITNLDTRSAVGTNGVVSSASPYASQAGIEILEKGGNAYDAAVAVAFTLGVVEPFASGVGGGGLMVSYNAEDGEYVSYNFREFVSGNGTANNYRQQYVDNFDLYYAKLSAGEKARRSKEDIRREYLDGQGDASNIFKDGALSCGVPTEVAGLCTIFEEQGSGNVTLAEVLAPAIRYAEEGFAVTANLANTFAELKSTLEAIPAAVVYFKDNDFSKGTLEEGDILIQKDYAFTLKEIAAHGKDGFYSSEYTVANKIIEAMEASGGLITQEDLDYASENYPARINPVIVDYKGYTIASSNVPSSGGTILAETLNLLTYYQEHYNVDISKLGHNSASYINVLATALDLAYSDKRKYIADTTNDETITNYIPYLTSYGYAAYRWDSVYEKSVGHMTGGKADPIAYNYLLYSGEEYYGDLEEYLRTIEGLDVDLKVTNGIEPEEHYSTTSFSVADKDGNIVSVTQTINHFFGCHIVPSGCGFFLNNQLGTCSFNGSSVNYVKPYKQPVSHIMPTIITKDGLPYATLGSPGSMRIPSTVIQVILNLIEFDMDIQEAIDAPRIFAYSTGGGDDDSSKENGKMLWIEEPSRTLKMKLMLMGYYLPTDNVYNSINLYFGGVHGITFNSETGEMMGGADPRRDGKALAF